MPARSGSQQRFMGLVHAVQSGRKAMSDVSPDVARVARTMTPKDVTEFASTKHKDLPDKVRTAEDGDARKAAVWTPSMMLSVVCSPWLPFGCSKSASLEAAVRSTEKQLQAAQRSREQSLKAHAANLQSRLAAAEGRAQTAEQAAQQSQAEGQAALSAMAQPGPQPPSAQVPYGQMLTGAQSQDQSQQK